MAKLARTRRGALPAAGAAEVLALLPASARTLSGIVFNPNDDIWSYRDGVDAVSVNFALVPSAFYGLLLELKIALLAFARSNAPKYLQNIYSTFLFFCRSIDGKVPFDGEIDALHVESFRATLVKRNEFRLSQLSPLLQRWHDLGLPSVTDACVEYLNEIRKPGNPKGGRVKTHDPVHGAFTEEVRSGLAR